MSDSSLLFRVLTYWTAGLVTLTSVTVLILGSFLLLFVSQRALPAHQSVRACAPPSKVWSLQSLPRFSVLLGFGACTHAQRVFHVTGAWIQMTLLATWYPTPLTTRPKDWPMLYPTRLTAQSESWTWVVHVCPKPWENGGKGITAWLSSLGGIFSLALLLSVSPTITIPYSKF